MLNRKSAITMFWTVLGPKKRRARENKPLLVFFPQPLFWMINHIHFQITKWSAIPIMHGWSTRPIKMLSEKFSGRTGYPRDSQSHCVHIFVQGPAHITVRGRLKSTGFWEKLVWKKPSPPSSPLCFFFRKSILIKHCRPHIRKAKIYKKYIKNHPPLFFSEKKSLRSPFFSLKKSPPLYFFKKKSSPPCRWSRAGYPINFDPCLISIIPDQWHICKSSGLPSLDKFHDTDRLRAGTCRQSVISTTKWSQDVHEKDFSCFYRW